MDYPVPVPFVYLTSHVLCPIHSWWALPDLPFVNLFITLMDRTSWCNQVMEGSALITLHFVDYVILLAQGALVKQRE